MDDSPAPVQKRGTKGMAAVIAVALIIILTALFVFPGFVAAGFSKAGVVFIVDFPGDDWDVTGWSSGPMRQPMETQIARVLLYPAYQIMRHSSSARKFYEWEFNLAGGLSLNVSS